MADREFSKGALTRLSWGALIVGILVVLLAILAYPLEIAPTSPGSAGGGLWGSSSASSALASATGGGAKRTRLAPVTYRGWNASPAKLAGLISRPAMVPGLRVGPVTPQEGLA